ncbi:MAG: hypothetical protein ABSF95_20025, partial [Verrucomicrobiota bacterium]
MKRTMVSLVVMALFAILATPQVHADLLQGQRPAVPELKTSPETGSPLSTGGTSTAEQWKLPLEEPGTVPVQFCVTFTGSSDLTAALNGCSVTGWPDEDNYWTGVAGPGEVRLVPYKTYALSFSGDDIANAVAALSAVPLYLLLPDQHTTGDPARNYCVYMWNPQSGQWQKVCSSRTPQWDAGGVSSAVSVSFLIQVRPDLGSRPVIYGGAGAAAGEDQADDGWTRDEPPMNATTVIGDGEAVSLGAGTEADPAAMTLKWAVSLGRLWNGGSAGRLRLLASRLDTNAYSPRALAYAARSTDTNEVAVLMDLDDTNCISQIKVPHGLAAVDLLYGSALFSVADLLNVPSLVQKLTDTNQPDPVSEYLWTNFSAQAQAVLTNTNSTLPQLQSTLVQQFDQIIQAGPIYDAGRFAGVSLPGRTRRLLLLNPQGDALVRLNRFLLEDAYPVELARLLSYGFQVEFYVSWQVGSVDSLGFFTVPPNESGFVIWRVDPPDLTTNNWRLQEIRNGLTNGTTLQYGGASQTWTLTQGAGAEARIETRAVTITTGGGVTNRMETQEIKSGQGTACTRNAEVYQGFPWAYELVAVTNDPGGANLVTRFTYGSDTNNQESYEQVLGIVYPDGYWETRQYCTEANNSWRPYGSLLRAVHPWKDTPTGSPVNDCLVTDYEYPGGYPGYAPGGYLMTVWHDALRFGEDTNYFLSKYKSTVHGESLYLYDDDCGDSQTFTEWRALGSGDAGAGEVFITETYSPSAGRAGGQLRSKQTHTALLDSYDYEFGAWDSTNLVFTVSQDGSGLDLRQTIYQGIWPGCGPAGYLTLSVGASGQSIEPVNLVPGRSTKEVRIIQNGNLVAKEKYVYQDDQAGFALIEQTIYERDCLGHAINVFRIDPATRQQRVIYQADWTGGQQWPTDLKFSETDEKGVVTQYAYDWLKRLKTSARLGASAAGYPAQSAITNTLAYDPSGRTLTNTTSGGALCLRTVSLYDLCGRVTTQISPEGLVTAYSYTQTPQSGLKTTITSSSGATKVIQNYLDRRVASITGSAVTNVFTDYGQTGLGVAPPGTLLVPKNMTTNTLGWTNSLRWTAQATDPRYELAAEVSPGFQSANFVRKTYQFWTYPPLVGGVSETAFETGGTLAPDWQTVYDYDLFGQRTGEERYGPDADGWGTWTSGGDAATTERITTYTNFYQLDGQDSWFLVSEQWTYPYNSNATPALVERTRERLTGFTADELSETQKFDADTNQTTVTVSVDLANKKVTTVTSGPQSSLSAVQVAVNGLLQTESTPTVAAPTCHYYDNLGREIGVQDPLGNLTGTRYDTATGQVTATTNAQGLVSTMQYYPAGGTNAGLLKCTTGPTGKKTYYNYNGCGQLTHVWGDVPYPEKREYNQFGDQTALTTYRGGSQWTGPAWPTDTGPTADVTRWYYDEPTGLLTNKTDAAGQHVTFDYYNNHYPRTRLWARGAASTNLYCPNGDLVRIDYSDSSSVVLTNAAHPYLSRQARPEVAIDASGTNVLTYDSVGRVVSSACTGGLLGGITLTNHFDPVYGRDMFKVLGPGWSITNNYSYDAYGRLGSVSNGLYSAVYGYLPNSDLLQTTTCKSNTTTVLTTTRTWESGPRLRSVANTASGAVVTSHGYVYDALDRRQSAVLGDGSHWQYTYNDRNELIAARRFWSDWSPLAGQQSAYAYDNLGNRTSASSGGDTNGANLRQTAYTVNALNQYTAITTPGYQAILGAAIATNTVGVTNTLTGAGGLADRKGEYFHRELSIANTNAPLWQTVSATSGGTTTNGGLLFPASNQTLTYDLDGNLSFDGIWTYQWDCENRLAAMSMTNVAGVANSNRLRLEFAYD